MSRLERIVAALGGELLENGTRALVPGPGHDPRDRSVSLLETENGRVLIHCFSPKDDWRDVRRELEKRGLLAGGDSAKLAAMPWSAPGKAANNRYRLGRAERIWNEARPIRLTPAERYLSARGIHHASNLTGLRFHARMTSLEDRLRRPALVSAILDNAGATQGVQVTLLSPDGATKAALATPRRVIGKMMGGAVRLDPCEDELAIGEGVETMLSVRALFAMPSWAALSARNLALFNAPTTVKRLIVAVDPDAAGRAAADALRARLSPRIDVKLLTPQGDGDWNSWAMKRTLS